MFIVPVGTGQADAVCTVHTRYTVILFNFRVRPQASAQLAVGQEAVHIGTGFAGREALASAKANMLVALGSGGSGTHCTIKADMGLYLFRCIKGIQIGYCDQVQAGNIDDIHRAATFLLVNAEHTPGQSCAFQADFHCHIQVDLRSGILNVQDIGLFISRFDRFAHQSSFDLFTIDGYLSKLLFCLAQEHSRLAVCALHFVLNHIGEVLAYPSLQLAIIQLIEFGQIKFTFQIQSYILQCQRGILHGEVQSLRLVAWLRN
ncbi:hypothetical protein EVA_06448 [gut metagenome]|uniref:Uncharacterized protein n=1 Tax=gut metagenome TaxID=749906 RepID=J9GEW4_9ZZZZ